ncbi:MAG: hypothetical protein Crog4KO_31470 [Crocinitomicaceae bacterium]
MKVLAIIIISLFSTQYANAQAPDYFADEPEWNQYKFCSYFQCFKYITFIHYLNGDSTINSISYRKVYSRGYLINDNIDPWTPGCTGTHFFDEFDGLIRQDSMSIYTWDGTRDTLLYDFDLSVGDTLPQTAIHSSPSTIVDSINTIIVNGTPRKKIFISDTNSMVNVSYIIEGVGSDKGLYELFTQDNSAETTCNLQELKCFRVNNQIEFGTDCDFDELVIGIPEKAAYDKVNLFPNPTHGGFSIKYPESSELLQVDCFSSSGSRIKMGIDKTEKGLVYGALDSFPDGIYFIELTFQNGLVIHKKLVKQ